MGKIILITGGARSGKSSFAIELAKSSGKKVAFIATCQPLDEEMKKRIEQHRNDRPDDWETIEEPLEIASTLKKLAGSFDVAVIDCLTLLISNYLSGEKKEKEIEEEIDSLLETVSKGRPKVIIVTNEVGMGIVPGTELGRSFRDIAGRINQTVAKRSDEVYMLNCGIPVKIKG